MISDFYTLFRWKEPTFRGPFAQPRIRAKTPEDGTVALHPSSVMAYKLYPGQKHPLVATCATAGANWLVYWLKQKSSDLFLIDNTLVYTLPFLFFGELVVSECKCYVKYYL